MLEIRDLSVDYVTNSRPVRVVDGVSLKIEPGERVGLVGESGAGKSVTARAVLGLIESPGRVVGGEVLLDGRNLLELSEARLAQVRGSEVGLIFQNPSTALNPAFRAGWQLEESLKVHADLSRADVHERALSVLGEVGIPEPALLSRRYPHQFSGGMQQRLYIAMTLIAAPRLLIADEPTTALDVTIQAQILDLLLRIAADSGMALVLITHDMGVVARVCDRVAVMYAGEVVEDATVDQLFNNPLHPYTRALLECLPDPTKNRRHVKAIPGSGTQPGADLPGCRFRDRCALARDICHVHPELLDVESRHAVRCWVSQEEGRLPESPASSTSSGAGTARRGRIEIGGGSDRQVLLTVRDVRRRFSVRGGVLQARREVRAVDGVTLDVRLGETLGVVGESGSGKSTLARLMVGLEKPTAGAVTVAGVRIDSKRWRVAGADPSARPQMVFQNPETSLDPRIRIGNSVGEPLIGVAARRRNERVKEMLELVGLDPSVMRKYPHQLSGGQQQRACVARALIAGAKIVVFDEALSSLDASMQARMINLLDELRASLGLTYVFISHNLSVVDAIADRTCVMYLGRVVELGASSEMESNALHPYTAALHAAVPVPNPEYERRRERLILRGEIGSSSAVPAGCRFHPRCPLATDLCRESEPELAEHRPQHWAACHYSGEWAAHRAGDPRSLTRRMLEP